MRATYSTVRIAVIACALLACADVALACTWKGNNAGNPNVWSDAANWTDCGAAGKPVVDQPVALTFPTNALSATSRDDINGLVLTDVTIEAAPPGTFWNIFSLGVNGVSVTITGTLSAHAEGATFSIPIIAGTQAGAGAQQGMTIKNDGGDFTVGNISTDNDFVHFDNTSHVTVSGAISGAGNPDPALHTSVLKTNTGPVLLFNNTYTGSTTVQGGALIARTATSFGAGGVNNIVRLTGGSLQLGDDFADGVTIGQSIQFVHGGSLLVPAGKSATVTGDITSGDVSPRVVPLGTLTIAGRISSGPTAPTWQQQGTATGRVILTNPQNTFSAWTVVNGTLKAGVPGAIPAGLALTLSTADNGAPAILDLTDLNGVDVTLSSLAGRKSGVVQLGANTLTLNIPDGLATSFSGTIAGTGNLVKDGPGAIQLSGNQANTFTGTTTVKAGELGLFNETGNAILGPLVISGGQLFVVASNQIADNVTVTVTGHGKFMLNGNTDVTETIGALEGDGTVDLGTGTLTVGRNSQSTTFSGQIQAAPATPGRPGDPLQRLIKIGTGTLTLTQDVSLVDQLIVADGALILNGPGTLDETSGVTVQPGATLGGNALFGVKGGARVALTVGGTINPGTRIPGVMGASDATFAAGSTFNVALNGLTAGPGYNQLDLTGNLTLSATTQLNVTLGFNTFFKGTTFTIAQLAPGHTTTGTFANLPEGATVPFGERHFSISYHGGDGNDVVLTATDNPPSVPYYLSEGATSNFFDEDILIANPNADPAPVTITFSKEDGSQVVDTRTVPAQSRMTVVVKQIKGMEGTSASALITSTAGLPLAVERTMFWDATRYAGATGSAVDQPAPDWFFAEGSQGFFFTFVLINNPNPTPTDVTFTFFREAQPPVVKTFTVGATTRFTLDCGSVPEIVGSSFGIAVHATQPVMAERSMYFGDNTVSVRGGTESAGVTAPATHWFMAEGATGGFFTTFVLVSNPQDTDAHLTFQYLLAAGDPITVQRTLPAHKRLTTNVQGEDDARLHDTAVSTVVTSDVPVIAERSMYWAAELREGHNSFGVTDAGLKWGLAEGRTGTPFNYHTFILLANAETTAANVKATFLRENGAPVVKTYTVAPTSRFNIDSADLKELKDESFAAVIEVTNNVPITVERSMYWDANGVGFSGGSNATGIRLP